MSDTGGRDAARPRARVRDERAADGPAVRGVVEAAFGSRAEADLVAALHAQAAVHLSLVAEVDDAVVGQVLFSPVTVDDAPGATLMGLAPMSVLPAHQRRGVGTALAGAGIERCRASGVAGLVVLGHPGYYPRFGFVPAARHGLGCVYEVEAEAFMALELAPGSLAGVGGTVRYHPAFDRL